MIAIIDNKMGNLGSIENMLKKVGSRVVISADLKILESAEKLILSGIGTFDSGMAKLAELKILPLLKKRVLEDKIPILGICLGMQLLTKKSEEGKLAGLGLIDAETIRFRFDKVQNGLKIPHMGWNSVLKAKNSRLFLDEHVDQRFYFVHSYHLKCNDKNDILAKTYYGYEFVSAVERQNIAGVQFHPEKSHKFGMKLLKNFAEKF